jgi:hypothetical protein
VYRHESLHEDGSRRTCQQFIKSVGRDPRFVTPIEVRQILERIQAV